MTTVQRAAELAARSSYGRLLSILSARTHDIAMAEDALSEAFAKALRDWPDKGVPSNPDAWLLTVARNGMTDRQRHQMRFPTENELPDLPDTGETVGPDERLALLMVCAHPAIAPDLHTPLMLQTVLGIEAKVIARLFMISPAALSKRLVRAKAKIRDAGIPFRIPDHDALPERATAIFEALYALHATDWLDPSDTFGDEALFLADLLTQLLPTNAEARGLASLIALSHARRDARIAEGVLVPTPVQDPALWDAALIQYGQRQLHRANGLNAPGRFQTEAAIEAVHIARKNSGNTDWAALNQLYHALLEMAPSTGALVAQAAITGHLHGPRAGLSALDKIAERVGNGFQPYWAVRGELEAQLGHNAQALTHLKKALSLATDGPTQAYLRRKIGD